MVARVGNAPTLSLKTVAYETTGFTSLPTSEILKWQTREVTLPLVNRQQFWRLSTILLVSESIEMVDTLGFEPRLSAPITVTCFEDMLG